VVAGSNPVVPAIFISMEQTLQVILLAILQGIAEFLPISSSGHLVLGQALLGMKEAGITLEVALHAGTLVSTLIYYRTAVLKIITGLLKGCRDSWRTALYIVIAGIPAIVFYLLCKKHVDAAFENPAVVGCALLFTGVVITSLRWIPARDELNTFWRATFIGVAQAIAILPGVSRSGMTISAARFSGISPEKSAEFSFLASIPLIAGASLKKLLESFQEAPAATEATLSPLLLLFGAGIAAIVGYFALAFLVKTLRGRFFWCFGIYCLIAGCCTILFTR
jgi:undecaprenyl-diphosphatase